jgi:molybdopterin molybdotransferase
VSDLLDVDDARARILAHASPVSVERVGLIDPDPRPRVLASTMTSKRALPPFTNSAMDGYGVAAGTTSGTQLRIVGQSRAGHGSAVSMGPGEAIAITTGAPIPAGVDAVVMRELCDESRVSEGVVVVNHTPAAGEHVRARGEDVQEGAVVGAAGDVVTPARLNLLLSAGHVSAAVFRRPVVCVLASGDELREIGDGIADDVIVNSNAWATAAAARSAGADVRMLGIAKDTLEDHVQKIDVDDADVVVTIGGVSVGSHDFVRPALLQLGATLHLWKIAMRPGKPLAFGSIPRRRRRPAPQGSVLVLGLPGNPVSALVTFTIFGLPLLRALAGRSDVLPPVSSAILDDDRPFVKKKGLRFFARARLEAGRVRLLERQGSGQISGLADANALACLDKDAERVEPGSIVEVIPL